MADADGRITFLPCEEIRETLTEAIDPHAGERLSALIWANVPDGDLRKLPKGVVMRVLLAITDYVTGVTEGMPAHMAQMLAYPIQKRTPTILRACVSDEDWPAVEAVWLTVSNNPKG